MSEIILYTTHCPKCEVLKKKMDIKNIDYSVITNTDIILTKGSSVPMLEIDGKVLNFVEANTWISKA